MKAITVFYNIATDSEVMDLILKLGVHEYSKMPRTTGRGVVSGPRLDDHVWPGFNVTLIMVVADELAPKIMTELQTFRDGPLGSRTGIYAYQTHVEAALLSPNRK